MSSLSGWLNLICAVAPDLPALTLLSSSDRGSSVWNPSADAPRPCRSSPAVALRPGRILTLMSVSREGPCRLQGDQPVGVLVGAELACPSSPAGLP